MPMILPLFAAAVTTAADRAVIMVPVDGLFAALSAGDGPAMLTYVWGHGGVTVATEREAAPSEIRQMDWKTLAAAIRPGGEPAEETLGDTIVRQDGDVAVVWGRYTYRIGGVIHHCGMDHFELVRADGQWKVTNLAWSIRTTGCEVRAKTRRGPRKSGTGASAAPAPVVVKPPVE